MEFLLFFLTKKESVIIFTEKNLKKREKHLMSVFESSAESVIFFFRNFTKLRVLATLHSHINGTSITKTVAQSGHNEIDEKLVCF